MKLKGTKLYAAVLEGNPQYLTKISTDIEETKTAMDSKWDKIVEITITRAWERTSLQEIETDCNHE